MLFVFMAGSVEPGLRVRVTRFKACNVARARRVQPDVQVRNTRRKGCQAAARGQAELATTVEPAGSPVRRDW